MKELLRNPPYAVWGCLFGLWIIYLQQSGQL